MKSRRMFMLTSLSSWTPNARVSAKVSDFLLNSEQANQPATMASSQANRSSQQLLRPDLEGPLGLASAHDTPRVVPTQR